MAFRPGQFKINGSDSEEFNAYLTKRPERVSAGRVIELRERPGNDSVVIDFAYYKNVEWKIPCVAFCDDLEEMAHLEDRIKAWLDMSNYSDFTFNFDEYYIYQAVVTSPPVFNGTHKNGSWTPFDFTISIRPFKTSRVGMKWLAKPTSIHNPEQYPSKPKIEIKGSGDIDFWINDKKFELTSVNSEIIIDSYLEESYRVTDETIESQDNKTKFLDFPELAKGFNNIRWSGDVQEFNLLPRWWTKV